MKICLKNYSLHILSAIILITIALFSIMGTIKWDNRRIELDKELYNSHCVNQEEIQEDTCNKIGNRLNQGYSFFPIISQTVSYDFRIHSAVVILFVIVPSGIYISKYMKNRIVLAENNRANYKKSIRRVFIKSYLSALIIPLALLIIFVVCFVHTKGFHFKIFEEISLTPWQQSSLNYPLLFLGSWIFNTVMIGLIYVNCNLIVFRKFHNYFIATILTFLLIIGIELFFEIVINTLICRLIFNSEIGIIFNILNPLTFLDNFGVLPTLTFTLSVCLVSFIAVILLYRNKENLILDCEKNI